MQQILHFFQHRSNIGLSQTREHKGGKPLLLFLKLPWLSLLLPLSWHSDTHDKSTEANCELCLGLDRKQKGISGVVTGQNNGWRLRLHQESSVRLQFSTLRGKWISVFTCMHVDISALPSLLNMRRCLCWKENAKSCVMRCVASGPVWRKR